MQIIESLLLGQIKKNFEIFRKEEFRDTLLLVAKSYC